MSHKKDARLIWVNADNNYSDRMKLLNQGHGHKYLCCIITKVGNRPRSICILTRPVVNTGFNRSLLVDWWSIGRLKKTDGKILSISYPILLDSINRLRIVSI